MTSEEITAIKALRAANYSYSFIARELGISINTIKAYCVRHGIKPTAPRKTKQEKAATRLCKNCHQVLPEGIRADRLFCSNSCRTKWNRKRRKLVNSEIILPEDIPLVKGVSQLANDAKTAKSTDSTHVTPDCMTDE